jgi:hypothetical protein
MSSRQPGSRPSGAPDSTGTAGARWAAVRLVPLALLVMVGLAGLRGVVGALRWDGPLHRDGAAVGAGLEVVLGTLLVITLRRRRAVAGHEHQAPGGLVAAKLRAVLVWVLGAAMLTVAVVTVSGLHLHLFSGEGLKPRRVQPSASSSPPPPPHPHAPARFTVPLSALLYGLLVVALLAGVVLSIWWARRLRPAGPAVDADDLIAEDSADLRQAVGSGLSALRTLDDARAAIIACYVAMERSLAERGAARGVADTPDELLARATRSGVVRGTAAARLTALFYEARYSSHPLGRRQRAAAEQALGELAAALGKAAGSRRPEADGPEPARSP